MKKHIKPWALVLSGGGARGIAHIGVLKGLEDAGFPRPSCIVGTSMGAIVGGLYACGMEAEELIRFVIEQFNIADYLESFTFRISGPVGKLFQTGQALATLATRTGIDPGYRILDLFETLTGGKKIEETRILFRCNALDLLSGQEVVFRSGSVARAIRASMSFPLFFEPLIEGGMCLVDGGLWDNMPVAIARNEGYEKVLAINVNHFAANVSNDLRNGPQIIYRSIECALNFQEKKMENADLTLNVSDDTTPFSFFRQKELVELGEQAVRNDKEALEAFFTS